jgi:multidrug efflux pump subunit AcrA (membrane-fusion protein)
VLVELNTEKNKTYEAYISKIYPHFNETTQSYKVEARFLQQQASLISGTQLQANIIADKKDKALLIPRDYLFTAGTVLMRDGKKIDTVKIVTGIVSDEWVEVLSGLTTTDKIVKLK